MKFEEVNKQIKKHTSDDSNSIEQIPIDYRYPDKVISAIKYPSVSVMMDATASSRDDPIYITPKHKIGTVVTYLEDGNYKMGRITGAILIVDTWKYVVSGARNEIFEKQIKQVIELDNQEFFDKL